MCAVFAAAGCLSQGASLFDRATAVQPVRDDPPPLLARPAPAPEAAPATPAQPSVERNAFSAQDPSFKPKIVNTPQGRMVQLPDGTLRPLMNSQQAAARLKEVQTEASAPASVTEPPASAQMPVETSVVAQMPANETPVAQAPATIEPAPKVAEPGFAEFVLPDGRVLRVATGANAPTQTQQDGSLRWSEQAPGTAREVPISAKDIARDKPATVKKPAEKKAPAPQAEPTRRSLFSGAQAVSSKDGDATRVIPVTVETSDGNRVLKLEELREE